MKKVEAIIRTEKLSDVKRALAEEGFIGLTIYNVQGRGRQKGIKLQWRGTRDYRVDMLPKTKLEIVVNGDNVQKVVNLISKAAFTGNVGDGKIFVLPVEEVVRVRTGESGNEAI